MIELCYLENSNYVNNVSKQYIHSYHVAVEMYYNYIQNLKT